MDMQGLIRSSMEFRANIDWSEKMILIKVTDMGHAKSNNGFNQINRPAVNGN